MKVIPTGTTASSLVIVLCAWTLAPSDRAGTWEAAASMNVTREYPGLAVMPDGNILAVTGHPLGGKSLASAEIYDPRQNVWKPTGSLNVARNGVDPGGLIPLPNGKFLIAGGGTASRSVHEAELYDYKTRAWTSTGSMHFPRCVHSATQLLTGDVLVVGGIDWTTEEVLSSAEVYDYKTGAWNKTGSMATPRFSHRAVLLLDGRVMVTGGNRGPGDNVVASAEIYDPKTGVWRETTPMRTARRGHSAAVLQNGQVLVAGGSSGHFKGNKQLSEAEVFDPRTERWTEVAPLREARWGASETMLRDGRVLVVGGAISPRGARSSAELYNPNSGTWSDAGSLKQARNGHRAVMLNDGRVLVVGGYYVWKYLATCEIYAPSE